MMTMNSKLDNNESGLIVPVKCVSAEIAALISRKRHMRVILENKILAHYMSTCYHFKNHDSNQAMKGIGFL